MVTNLAWPPIVAYEVNLCPVALLLIVPDTPLQLVLLLFYLVLMTRIDPSALASHLEVALRCAPVGNGRMHGGRVKRTP